MRRYLRNQRGNIAALTALLILPLAALLGMATEGGSWFLITRAMKRFIALVLAASFAVLATGCNTMQGLGRDVEKGGEKVQKEAVEHKKY